MQQPVGLWICAEDEKGVPFGPWNEGFCRTSPSKVLLPLLLTISGGETGFEQGNMRVLSGMAGLLSAGA
jgi:hypothetical protein